MAVPPLSSAALPELWLFPCVIYEQTTYLQAARTILVPCSCEIILCVEENDIRD